MTDKEKIECLSDLCRFLAIQQDELANHIMKAVAMKDLDKMTYHLVMETPKMQGTQNIINLHNIGKQKTNMKNISKAVNYLLGE